MSVTLSLLAAAALSAAAPAPADDTIVVEGQRLTQEELRTSARAMVRELAPPTLTDQYPRWTRPICPKVIGIADRSVAQTVSDKIRLVAAEAGIEVAKPSCKPNILVAFTDDAGKLFRTVAARRSQIFDAVLPREAAALRNSDLPVRWWYALDVAGSQGQQPVLTTGAAAGVNLPQTDFNGATVAMFSSPLAVPTTMAGLNSAAVIVDVNKAEGMRLDAIAAYVAMVSLAPSKMPPRALGVPSITNIFAGDHGVTDLTAWDRAYLEGLYSTPYQRQSLFHRAAIAGRMAERIGGR